MNLNKFQAFIIDCCLLSIHAQEYITFGSEGPIKPNVILLVHNVAVIVLHRELATCLLQYGQYDDHQGIQIEGPHTERTSRKVGASVATAGHL